MRKSGKVTSVLLALMMVGSIVIPSNQITNIEAAEKQKKFIIVTRSRKDVKTIEAKYDTIIEEEEQNTDLLRDENIIVSNMTGSEAKKIEKDGKVEKVEEDVAVTASTKTDNQIAGDSENTQWNLKSINADMQESEPTKKVKVALLDSGVDFQDGINVKERINLINDGEEFSPILEDASNHGTSIASVIAGEGSQVQGVNKDVELYSARILDDEKQAPVSRVIEGIYWAIDKGVNIISISFGTSQYSEALKQAIDDANAKGILVVAAAGNQGESGTDNVEYPAAFDNVMAVGSVDSKARVSDFSSTGKEIDVVAPGEAVRATGAFEETMITSGTSMAVPHVVGVASRLWQKNLSKSNEFIKKLVEESAKTLGDKSSYGNGLVDCKYAEEMYDFAENQYETEKNIDLQENKDKVQTFDNKDESKVEGTWTSSYHQKYLNDNGINIPAYKTGATYPDKEESGMKGMSDNPDFHGFYLRKYENKENVNILASYRFIIKIGNAYGKGNTYTAVAKSDIPGLTQKSYDSIRARFKGINSKIKSYSSYSNRKAFVFGIAMHTVTDMFAHSTYRFENGKWCRITHPNADDISVQSRRFKMAYRTERNNVYRYQGKRADVPVCHDFHASKDTTGAYYTSDTANKYYRVCNMSLFSSQVHISDNTVKKHYTLINVDRSENIDDKL
ncbi:MAG: S8 family serine peptidase [Anaerostipes sp.]|nr:S8 family serine peptidase [Anaerostipes sp.]